MQAFFLLLGSVGILLFVVLLAANILVTSARIFGFRRFAERIVTLFQPLAFYLRIGDASYHGK